jgi:dTDP-4-amino-4,6-dideoxygalactose transaminase
MAVRPPAYQVAFSDNTIGQDEIDAVTAVLASRWLSAGRLTQAFEREFAAALDVPDAVAVSSGTAALHLAFLALDLRPGDEVIVPSLSFVASAAVAALCDAVPVFADVRSESDLTIAPAEVERLITERTRAVVAMHYGGYPAQVAEIAAIARARRIPVIEDAAHAPVAHLGGRALGTFGDIGCFSFYATKNITTGEGGMVVARDRDVLERIRAMRSHCLTRSTQERMLAGTSDYDVSGIGLNYRPTEISSALGRVQLGKLPQDRAQRRRLVARYGELLAGLPGVTIASPVSPEDAAYHLMAIVLPPGASRGDVQRRLAAAGCPTSVHYPPTHLLAYYRDRHTGWREAVTSREHLPVTEAVAGRLLSLPLHCRMSEDDVRYVVAQLDSALRPDRNG